jgi:hypothetical protein
VAGKIDGSDSRLRQYFPSVASSKFCLYYVMTCNLDAIARKLLRP